VAAQEAYFDAQIRHGIGLRNLSSGEVKQVRRIAILADRELDELLRSRLTTDMSFTSQRWKRLQADIRELRAASWQQMKAANRQSMIDLAKAEQDFAHGLVQAHIPVQLDFALAGTERLVALVTTQPFSGGANAARTLGQWWDGVRAADQRRIMEALQLGVLQGESVPQMAARVQAGMEMSRRNAEAIVRTAVNHASSTARDAFFQANSDVLSVEMWSAMLDGRTTAVCRGRDGHYAPVDGMTMDGVPEPHLDPPSARPPAHPQCRSQMVGVLNPDGIAARMGSRAYVRDTRTRRFRERDFRAETRDKVGAARWKRMTTKQRTAAIARTRKAWARDAVG